MTPTIAATMTALVENLDADLTSELRLLIAQARHALPTLPDPVDFSASAYRWSNGQLQPIHVIRSLHLTDLLGIERQKTLLLGNTRQFLAGLPANDILMTGARGTGKSSLIRAVLTDLANEGLRVIEVSREDLKDIAAIQAAVGHRPEKYLIFCDDLAFNAEDDSYRALKSALDGSLASGKGNTLIYATSNRRHLLPEFMHENLPVARPDAEYYREIHPQESVEEKVSLSDRFGLWLPFHSMDQDLYLSIVSHWIGKSGMTLDEACRAEAIKWALTRGQRSGRSAAQFARNWVGQKMLAGMKGDFP